MCSRGQSADIHAPDATHPLTQVEQNFTSAKCRHERNESLKIDMHTSKVIDVFNSRNVSPGSKQVFITAHLNLSYPILCVQKELTKCGLINNGHSHNEKDPPTTPTSGGSRQPSLCPRRTPAERDHLECTYVTATDTKYRKARTT